MYIYGYFCLDEQMYKPCSEWSESPNETKGLQMQLIGQVNQMSHEKKKKTTPTFQYTTVVG